MKKNIARALGLVIILSLASLIVAYFIGVSKETWLIWVTAVAVICELSFWALAATLGVAVYQARRKVLSWIAKPFTSQKSNEDTLSEASK